MRYLAVGLAAFVWLSWFTSIDVYTVQYRTDRAVIVAYPQTAAAHKLGMETKEHIFYTGLVLATSLPLLAYAFDLKAPWARRALMIVAAVLLVVRYSHGCARGMGLHGGQDRLVDQGWGVSVLRRGSLAVSAVAAFSSAALFNAILVVVKETDVAVRSWLRDSFGHHWTGHGVLTLLVFLAAALASHYAYRGAEVSEKLARRLATLVVATTLISVIVMAGFYLLHL